MLTFNGLSFAKNEAEFVGSLFTKGKTCHGFYKRIKNGVKLFDMQKELQAFIVDRPGDTASRFIVTASLSDKKPFYMFSTCQHTEKWLNIFGMSRGGVNDAINLSLN